MSKNIPMVFSSWEVRANWAGLKWQKRRPIRPGRGQGWLTVETINRVKRFAQSPCPNDEWWTMAIGEEFRIIHCGHEMDGGHIGSVKCPYGRVGDTIWVREKLARSADHGWMYDVDNKQILVDAENKSAMLTWVHHNERDICPSIHMPLWACRDTYTVTGVRAERLQDISEEDAIAEGISVGQRARFMGETKCTVCSRPKILHAGLARACRGMNGTVYDPTSYRGGYLFLYDSIHGDGAAAKNPWVWVIEYENPAKKGEA